MEAFNELIRTWWPVALFIGAGAVWAIRLEGRVNVLDRTVAAIVEGEQEWRRMHAAEIAPQTRRIDESLERMESGIEHLTESLGDVRERLVGVERAMNGTLQKWDHKTERRRT